MDFKIQLKAPPRETATMTYRQRMRCLNIKRIKAVAMLNIMIHLTDPKKVMLTITFVQNGETCPCTAAMTTESKCLISASL